MTTAIIIPFKKPIERIQDRKCSFCGTTEAQAKKFVASETSNHCICGECIVASKQRLEETK